MNENPRKRENWEASSTKTSPICREYTARNEHNKQVETETPYRLRNTKLKIWKKGETCRALKIPQQKTRINWNRRVEISGGNTSKLRPRSSDKDSSTKKVMTVTMQWKRAKRNGDEKWRRKIVTKYIDENVRQEVVLRDGIWKWWQEVEKRKGID